MPLIRLCFALMLTIAAGAASCEPRQQKPYIFGVFPHLPPSRLEAVYLPAAVEFQRLLGRPIQFRSASSFGVFMDRLRRKEFDIAFVQPFDYVRAHDDHGYLPLARRDEPLTSILVIREDEPYTGLADMQGKVVAHPPESAAVSILMEKSFRRAGLEPGNDVQLKYYRSHLSCLQKVMAGAADACATARQALRLAPSALTRYLRVIYETPAIPHTLYIVHSRVPAEDREKLKANIIGWPATPQGQKILQSGSRIPLVEARDEEYDIVRKLGSQQAE